MNVIGFFNLSTCTVALKGAAILNLFIIASATEHLLRAQMSTLLNLEAASGFAELPPKYISCKSFVCCESANQTFGQRQVDRIQ